MVMGTISRISQHSQRDRRAIHNDTKLLVPHFLQLHH
uniref:Uncharacterized protein n=1 Tax=Anguilla anguilla TaxID=7936 RepID=A0A0E9PJS0_ANGAN